MYTLLKKIVLILPFLLTACIKEGDDDCGVYLEFIFDYNMEYADSFNPQVTTVDVYIFDENGYYLFSRHADAPTDLTGGNRMKLDEGFSPGNYKVITIGALSRSFRFTDTDNKPLNPGVTTIEDVQLSLYHETNEVQFEFPHLWYGKPIDIEFRDDLSVWPVSLIRETNHFNISVEFIDTKGVPRAIDEPLYTFDIITPESGVYAYDNSARVKETLTYHPYEVATGNDPAILTEAKVNIMRLIADEPEGYLFAIRNTATGNEEWHYDLLKLLERTKPESRPDGSPLPFQEFLDRQGEWIIVILYNGDIQGIDDTHFAAVAIKVNGWIIWLNDIDL